ncbi:hypothetical protein V7S43_006577 [Phytophthora oleae]|uniref:RNA polymerase II-associated protein 3 n=1 Tax=Phytophthora oleae TaxID=2107226 RepID=A0ABD3FU27_9STRA
MKEDKSPSVVEVQHQIRANASQLQDYFSDLYTWEKNIGKEDSARKRASKTAKDSATKQATAPPRTPKLVGVGNDNKVLSASNVKRPGAHTYDKGYKRWEKFDVDAALREADGEEDSKQNVQETMQSSDTVPRRVTTTSKASSSAATTKTREELEKEEGNAHYKRGDYVAAIKSYTRCLGYSPQNAVVLSNRAMAYLKNREFANAEDDCTLALKADPAHIKSYSRRGTACNSLGKHRLALLDFHRAAMLDPKSRQTQAQIQSTRELIRTAIKRSPKCTEFSIEVVGENSLGKEPSPEEDGDVSEDKENVGSQQPATSSADTKQKPSPHKESVSGPLPESKPATVESTATKKKKNSAILPKLPNTAPATSYEFGRVWKTLALRGDADQKILLLKLRAEYLRMMSPPTLRTVFKTGMESDVLCEIFHVLRQAVLNSSGDTAVAKENNSLALAFASELAKIPRFNMTIMLLSDTEKQDMAWVINHLEALKEDGTYTQDLTNLKKLYELR